MLDKMMTSKTPVKKYDMKTVQGMRRAQFWSSLIMCYTHLRRGMIKPMMLQVRMENRVGERERERDKARERQSERERRLRSFSWLVWPW